MSNAAIVSHQPSSGIMKLFRVAPFAAAHSARHDGWTGARTVAFICSASSVQLVVFAFSALTAPTLPHQACWLHSSIHFHTFRSTCGRFYRKQFFQLSLPFLCARFYCSHVTCPASSRKWESVGVVRANKRTNALVQRRTYSRVHFLASQRR